VVLLSVRHTAVHVDERGRLHCKDGMACSYSEGRGIYAWHGVRIPEWIITQPNGAIASLLSGAKIVTMVQQKWDETGRIRVRTQC